MSIKRNYGIFLGAILFSLSVHAGMNDVVMQLLMDLPYIQSQPILASMGFIYLGFLGLLNKARCLSLLIGLFIFVGCLLIQSYTVHGLLRTPFKKSIFRMLIIGFVNSIVLFFVETIIVKFQQSLNDGLYSHYCLWGIISAMIIFAAQVIVAYVIYLRFDPLVNKKRLCLVMTCAILVSTIFLMTVHLIQRWEMFYRQFNWIQIV